VQRAWFLNFDADLELAASGGYTSPRGVRERQHDVAARARQLVPIGDGVINEDGKVDVAPSGRPLAQPLSWEGRAFCPTPRALLAFKRAGVNAPPAPPLEVLRRVNHRAFSAELGQTLVGARFCTTMSDLEATVAGSTTDWLLKRAFGFAGRGQQRLLAGKLDPTARAFADRALSGELGLQVEPLVERLLDVALHGFLTTDGAVVFGQPTGQTIDARGAWLSSDRLACEALSADEHRALLTEGQRASAALAAAGYFGPFGIDAFRYRGADGQTRFNPRCEINARYSMGWAIGMGERRPDLEPSYVK
jgi:hypothetical protein